MNNSEAIQFIIISPVKDEERFIDTYRRVGMTPFKERVYASN